MEKQVQEWRELGMVGDDFQPQQILNSGNLIDKLHPRYRFLPVDTKYFKDVELDILGLFDNLDEELDGWLIKSENYQALNTILPKWKNKVQCIYIDPPFNKDGEADYLYMVGYKDSTWCSILHDRLVLAASLLRNTGAIFVRCDYNGNALVRKLMDSVFGPSNFQNELVVSRFKKPSDRITTVTESLFFYAKDSDALFFQPLKRDRICGFCKQPIQPRWHLMLSSGEGKTPVQVFGRTLYPPRGQHWKYVNALWNRCWKQAGYG
jgi:hypothetical protein